MLISLWAYLQYGCCSLDERQATRATGSMIHPPVGQDELT